MDMSNSPGKNIPKTTWVRTHRSAGNMVSFEYPSTDRQIFSHIASNVEEDDTRSNSVMMR